MNNISALRELEKEYEHKARRALFERDERISGLYSAYPVLAGLDETRRQLVAEKFKLKRQKADREKIADVENKIRETDKRFQLEMDSLGISREELEPHYSCPRCHDTGFIAPSERCACFKQRLLELLYGEATLEAGSLNTFSQFRPEIFPDQPAQASQRRSMLRLKEIMENYAEAFPENPLPNIILTGETGTGKTFMLSCVAARVLERGYTVLALTSSRLMELLKKSMFSEQTELERIYSADLLLIDELGMEPMLNNVTIESLFSVINERIRRRKAILITTNLTPGDIKARYTERIASRLLDKRGAQVYRLSGIDLRTKKTDLPAADNSNK